MMVLLLLMVFLNHQWVWALAHIFLVISLMAILEEWQEAWSTCLRSWRLLRWILIPTLLLHALFTPGQIVFVGFSVPVSYEGLQLGLWLSLHLCEIYMATIFIGRILPMSAWLNMVSGIDVFYRRLFPYLHLMPMVLRDVRVLLRRSYRTWGKASEKMQTLPLHMVELIQTVERRSQLRAKRVWLSWNHMELEASWTIGENGVVNISSHVVFWVIMAASLVEVTSRYLWH